MSLNTIKKVIKITITCSTISKIRDPCCKLKSVVFAAFLPHSQLLESSFKLHECEYVLQSRLEKMLQFLNTDEE